MNQKESKMNTSDDEQAQIYEIEAAVLDAIDRGDQAELLELAELCEAEAVKLRAVFG
jgi:hypothetical protein